MKLMLNIKLLTAGESSIYWPTKIIVNEPTYTKPNGSVVNCDDNIQIFYIENNKIENAAQF